MKKFLSMVITLTCILALASVGVPSAAASSTPYAVISTGNITFEGSGRIEGDVLAKNTAISGRGWLNPVNGIVYNAGNVSSTNSHINVADFTGSFPEVKIPEYKTLPDNVFSGSFSDGSKDLEVGWSGDAVANNYTISENSYFNNLTVLNTLNLNIETKAGELRVIRVKNLNVQGSITLTGNGKAVIYVENMVGSSGGSINATRTSKDLTIVFSDSATYVPITEFTSFKANIIANNANFFVRNTGFEGNIYTGGNFIGSNSGYIAGLVYAPYSASELAGSFYINGQLVTKSLLLPGNTFVAYGPVSGLSDDIAKVVIPSQGSENGGEETSTGETIEVKVVTPKRMSIRLEDGRVLKDGDSFTAVIGKEIMFQMCSNNWDNDIYDENGNGIAGTVVYHFKVSSRYDERSYDPESHSFVAPKGDPVLRTDTNRCFMAYRYYFRKGNYNKQTGIENVVNTPLESLSVNLPLGATIKSDAYNAMRLVETANVFIETAEDKTISYKDYYWER